MCVSLFVISVLIVDREPLIAVGCLCWSVFYFIKTNKFLLRLRAFTLIELVAVVGILGVLLSIIISIKTDTVKADSISLKAQLMQAQTYSLQNAGVVIPFEIEGKLHNSVTASHILFFKNAVAVDSTGAPIIGFKYIIKDNHGKQKDSILYIKSFTGKLTFF
jgi:prepilin-type N-terminal cleavage/methylation domain-containing protein